MAEGADAPGTPDSTPTLLARFIVEGSKRSLSPSAMVSLRTPLFDDQRPTDTGLSVFAATDAPRDDKLAAGVHVAQEMGRKKLHRWHIFREDQFTRVGQLYLDVDGIPTFGRCRHANIRGWPPSKSGCLSTAQEFVRSMGEHSERPTTYLLPKSIDIAEASD